jgi:hypothetical protein
MVDKEATAGSHGDAVKTSITVIPGEAACHVKAEGGDGSGDPESIFKTSNLKRQTSVPGVRVLNIPGQAASINPQPFHLWIPDNYDSVAIPGMTEWEMCF